MRKKVNKFLIISLFSSSSRCFMDVSLRLCKLLSAWCLDDCSAGFFSVIYHHTVHCSKYCVKDWVCVNIISDMEAWPQSSAASSLIKQPRCGSLRWKPTTSEAPWQPAQSISQPQSIEKFLNFWLKYSSIGNIDTAGVNKARGKTAEPHFWPRRSPGACVLGWKLASASLSHSSIYSFTALPE